MLVVMQLKDFVDVLLTDLFLLVVKFSLSILKSFQEN